MGRDQYYMLVAIALSIVVAVIAFLVIGDLFNQDQDMNQEQPTTNEADEQEQEEPTESPQVQVEVLEQGTGDVIAQNGDQITVHYRGRLNDKNGEQFDSSYDSPSGDPFTIILGESQVIQGWHQGLQGVQTGQLIGLTIPSELGYGERGNPPDIPPNAQLYFEIRVVEVISAQNQDS